ncbi:MAG: hypothetical protein ABFS17_00100 [Chloroflexota bacterium]
MSAIIDIFSKTSKLPNMINAQDHWLLCSTEVAYKQSKEVGSAINQLGIGGPKHNARVWWQVCRGIQGRFKGSITALIEENQFDANKIYEYLQSSKTTFPVLSGPVVSIRWIDMVSRSSQNPLKNWESLRMPQPGSLVQAAKDLGIYAKELHPAVVSALELWNEHCQAGKFSTCEWDGCPKKQTDK